ncbi:MAG: BTAD domain-containing putative transcriptional regulator [Anaerolineae bacterium]
MADFARQIGAGLQAIDSPAAQGALVLLEPTSRYRSLLVASLLERKDRPVLYYALGPDDSDLPIFLTSLGRSLADQQPLGGQSLLALTGTESVLPDTWIEALLADLARVSDDVLLILDEYDRSDSSDDVQAFMTELAGKLPPKATILINSRNTPRLPWVALIAKRRATVISTENAEIRFPVATVVAEPQTPIDVYALGPGFVLLDNTAVESWEGHLPRLLFFFALERPAVTRSEICSAFWPDLDIEQAVNVFHVTKRRLHKALGMDALLHEDGFYLLNPALEIRSDVHEFVDLLLSARRATPESRLTYLLQAVDTYRGPYLQGHDDAWIAARRADYLDGYVEALSALSDIYLSQDRREQALAHLLRALAADFDRPALQRDVMKLYIDMGRRYEAAAHYKDVKSRLSKLRRRVWPEVEALYQEIAS